MPTLETDEIGIFLITPEEVRNLSGKPTTNEVSTDDLVFYINLGTGIIIGETKKTDWDAEKDGNSFESLQGAVILYAKSFVLEAFDNKDPNTIGTIRKEFWNILKSIKGGVNPGTPTEKAVFYAA